MFPDEQTGTGLGHVLDKFTQPIVIGVPGSRFSGLDIIGISDSQVSIRPGKDSE